MIAGRAQGQIDAEIDSVGVAQFDLRIISGWAKDANIGDDSLARADDGDELLGGEFAFLIKIFEFGEFAARAEEDFEVGRGDVHVTGGNIDDQRVRWAGGSRGRGSLDGGWGNIARAQS